MRIAENALDEEDSRYYLKVGGITTGAGLSLGPGVRLEGLAGGRIDANAVVAVSHRKYLLAEGSLEAPGLAASWIRAGLFARRKYFPQEDFFGIGEDSSRDRRVSYTYDENAGGGFLVLEPPSRSLPLAIEARVEYRHPDVGHGHDSELPSIEMLFDDGSAPGLLRQPDFVVSTGSIEYDDATPEGRRKSGGQYRASISRYDDRGSGLYAFNRFDAEVRQYVPLVPDRHILVFRAQTALTRTAGGSQVPFYYQPWLGGSTTLRSYRHFRFHDRNTLLLQAEYRWLLGPFLEAAVFSDAGTFAPSVSGLRLDNLLADYGVGFRAGAPSHVFLRLDAAFGGREGMRVMLKFSDAF